MKTYYFQYSTWNRHVNDIVKKANKRLFRLVLLKRAKLPEHDIINFYCTCIRPTLEYAAQVFHHSLPKYLPDELERVQKRSLLSFSGENLTMTVCSKQTSLLYAREDKNCVKIFSNKYLQSITINFII